MNEKGQAFTVFRLLIGGLIALAVLVIIISIISYMENFRYDISKQRLAEQFNVAMQSPNGNIVVAEDLAFRAGYIFSTVQLAKSSNTNVSCIDVPQVRYSEVIVNSISKTVKFNSNAIFSVYYKCDRSSETDCPIKCIISFGEPISTTP